jgi:hypothetical protein
LIKELISDNDDVSNEDQLVDDIKIFKGNQLRWLPGETDKEKIRF